MAHGTWDETNQWMLSAKEGLAETYQHLERYEEQETLLRENSLILIRKAGIDDSNAQEGLVKLGRCWASLLKEAVSRCSAWLHAISRSWLDVSSVLSSLSSRAMVNCNSPR